PSKKDSRSSSAGRLPIVQRPRRRKQRTRPSTPDKLNVRSARRLVNRAKTRGLRRLRTQQGKERLSHQHRWCLPCLTTSRPRISWQKSAPGWSDCVSRRDRKSTRLNSSHGSISYAVFCLKKKKTTRKVTQHKKTSEHSTTQHYE